MPSPINTFPRGLLGLLGSQTGGRVPQELSAEVSASIALDDFYLLSKSETLYDATGAITAVLGEYPNLSGILTVPEGEWWYVHRFTCEASIVLPAGETHAVAPCLITIGPAGAGITPWSLYPHSTFATPQRPFVGVEVNPFWMKNGERLGVYLVNVIGASLTVAYELKALVTRVSI